MSLVASMAPCVLCVGICGMGTPQGTCAEMSDVRESRRGLDQCHTEAGCLVAHRRDCSGLGPPGIFFGAQGTTWGPVLAHVLDHPCDRVGHGHDGRGRTKVYPHTLLEGAQTTEAPSGRWRGQPKGLAGTLACCECPLASHVPARDREPGSPATPRRPAY